MRLRKGNNAVLSTKGLNIPRYTIVYDTEMDTTTIKIHSSTKTQLDELREYKNESYDEVIKKAVFIIRTMKKEPKLSQQTIAAIEKARERMKKGEFLTEAEAKKRLGL